MTPQPGRAVTVSTDAERLTAEVRKRLLPASVSTPQLGSLLRREPATWLGLTGSEEAWTWDLTRLRLQRFRDITTPEGYLTELEQMVGIPSVPSIGQVQLPPQALPEAFDHLELAWRLVTGRRLVRVPRATPAATLGQPAASGDEFSSRCSALADLLSLFDQVVALRVGQQHSAAGRGERAYVALGLTSYGSDWAGAWDHVRAVAVGALTTIREEVATLIPD